MRIFGLFLLVLATLAVANSAEYYVAPDGKPDGSGAIDSPWDMTTALNHPRSVRPGDTIWIRGGTYTGTYRSTLAGTASSPITVRRYQQERAILDSTSAISPTSATRSGLTITGPYTYFWGLEFTNSNETRTYQNSQCWENQHCRGTGVEVFAPGVKLINLVIHDTGNGIGMWKPAIDAETYGCIIYNVGWQSDVRGSGHGLYAQNDNGIKRMSENIIFHGLNSGFHIFGGLGAGLSNFSLEGNVVFENGLLASDPNGWGILIGGTDIARNLTLRSNYLYNPASYTRSNNLDPSYRNGSDGVVVSDNVSSGYKPIDYLARILNLTASGNLFYGNAGTLATEQFGPNSTLVRSGVPNHVAVRRNRFETDRAHIVVFNGSRAATVAADVSGVLSQGDRYEVRDAQNYFGTPALSGTFDGSALQLPMTLTAHAAPVGTVPRPPLHTSSEFGAFVLLNRGKATEPPPPPTPPPTPDTTPPLISNVRVTTLEKTLADIAWTTDEPADSQVEYGLTNAYGSETPLLSERVTDRTVALGMLEPGTTYHFRVKSRDAAGNLATSPDAAFTTQKKTVAVEITEDELKAIIEFLQRLSEQLN